MKLRLHTAITGMAFIGFLNSCTSDDDASFTNLTVPDTYTFTRDSETSVSFSGQTTRLGLGEILATDLKDFSKTGDELTTSYSTGDGSKNLRSKTAASDDYFSTDTATAEEIRTVFDGYLTSQATEFLEAFDTADDVTTGSEGIAGKVTESDGITVRYVNGDGLEYDQAFTKGLTGALVLDQIVNNYLSRSANEAYQEANTLETLVDGKNYTTLEHYWDEAYGYVYGSTVDDTVNDVFLYKYLARYTTLEADVNTAFRTGRAAIVAKDYETVAEQVEILREKLSLVIAIRAVNYLNEGATLISLGDRTDAFHDLSEGYGFIYGLQFTRKPNTEAPYFTKSEVDGFIATLEAENGFYDITEETLTNMASTIATTFGYESIDTILAVE